MRDYDQDDQPYIVIEKHSGGGVGSLLLGVAIGAGVALLFAPRSGAETRSAIKRRARRATTKARDVAEGVTHQVADTFDAARQRVEEQIESARLAIEVKKQQVQRAMEAGREAAEQARAELEARLAQTKAAYHAGADVARAGRTHASVSVDAVDELDA